MPPATVITDTPTPTPTSQPLAECFGRVRLRYYEEMTRARAKDSNNAPLKDRIDALEPALASTLGHETDGPVTIKHGYNGKTEMSPAHASFCIGRL